MGSPSRTTTQEYESKNAYTPLWLMSAEDRWKRRAKARRSTAKFYNKPGPGSTSTMYRGPRK